MHVIRSVDALGVGACFFLLIFGNFLLGHGYKAEVGDAGLVLLMDLAVGENDALASQISTAPQSFFQEDASAVVVLWIVDGEGGGKVKKCGIGCQLYGDDTGK